MHASAKETEQKIKHMLICMHGPKGAKYPLHVMQSIHVVLVHQLLRSA